LESEFTLYDSKPPTRTRTACSEENKATVRASVAENDNVSIPHHSQELGLSTMTT